MGNIDRVKPKIKLYRSVIQGKDKFLSPQEVKKISVRIFPRNRSHVRKYFNIVIRGPVGLVYREKHLRYKPLDIVPLKFF